MRRNKLKDMWEVPRLWPGNECIILGGGPGMKGLNLELLWEKRVIAVNNAYKLYPRADVMFYGDCGWLPQHGAGLLDFAGLKVTVCEKHTRHSQLKVLYRARRGGGLARDRHTLMWNTSSGACAINLAVHLGVKRIVLLGFDMHDVDGKANFHDDYSPPLIGKRIQKGRQGKYQRFLQPFPQIARELKGRNVECINATPDSALDVFPICTPEEALC